MFRTVLTLVVFAVAIAALPGSAAAQEKPAAASKAVARPAIAGPINVNTASASDFEGLPGIGPAMAARIVEYRQKNGPFKKLEDLMNVRGLGEKNFLKLKPQLTLSTAKSDQDRQN